ncbi:MAG: rhodanese-like domain-containing protein [Kiritimatiellia bacterium]|jgi:rhodanese-related sulfurtransferase|nr:rhodanese-like domain-containing protein [Kiritimatiellia bacterium]MDP6630788.1 rhodanese-like domain-containing protein [Kiritimatiellia bacterium]MDP6809348.1 rhodanese-like domain-containing protein [Kiritimatiellia bacterium]MDP7023974.1 rhodanese-like domain-containing protein [Kiritimatiellia bacterium]
MKKHIMIVGLAALMVVGLGLQADAGCGACGARAEVKKACPEGCAKPCCEAPDAGKKACDAKCAGKKACAAKCADKKDCAAKCAMAGKKCAARSACSVKSAKGCPVKGACRATAPKKACGPDCKKPCCAAKAEIAEINTSGLKALLDSGAKVYVLDARSAKYDDGRRIPGAESLFAKATAKEAKKAVRSKNALIVTYCAGLKCPASAMLARNLKTLGYRNVIEYRHGIQGWTDAGHPVKTVKK